MECLCSIFFHQFLLCDFQGMTKLPDFKKIEFPSVPPIPMEEVVPEASPEVRHETSSASSDCLLHI